MSNSKKFNIRDENGIMKAKVSASTAFRLMNDIKGHFREVSYTSGKVRNAYVLEEDVSLTLGEFKIFLWKNDKLEQE